MSKLVPLCKLGENTIWTDASFWRWYNKPTTDGQISKLKYLIYNYNVEVYVPSKCGVTSSKISSIEKAIREGIVKPRKNKNGHIERINGKLKFVPMKRKYKKERTN